jgi:hypothetical protein
VDRVNNDRISDMDKLDDMMKLFGINYFKDENYNETGVYCSLRFRLRVNEHVL